MVVALVPTKYPEPNEEVITYLRELLRDAKQGKVQAIAISVAVMDDDNDRSIKNFISIEKGWSHNIGYGVLSLYTVFQQEYCKNSPTYIQNTLTEDDE